MARFEGRRSRNDIDSRGRSRAGPRRGSRGDSRGGRDFSRDKPVSMTKVICDDCGARCEVPFKPSSDKPVLCKDCFSSKKPNPGRDMEQINQKLDNIVTSKDLDSINKKLDKIIQALNIE